MERLFLHSISDTIQVETTLIVHQMELVAIITHQIMETELIQQTAPMALQIINLKAEIKLTLLTQQMARVAPIIPIILLKITH